MPSIKDISIIDSNKAQARKVDSGLEREICSAKVCNSKNLTVYRRTIQAGKEYAVDKASDYHLIYVMRGAPGSRLHFNGKANEAVEGAGVLVTPGESVRFEAKGGFVGSRSHHIAVDHLEECLDERGIHGVSACELVRGLEPVDAPVLSSDEPIEACRHVDGDPRLRVGHRFVGAACLSGRRRVRCSTAR